MIENLVQRIEPLVQARNVSTRLLRTGDFILKLVDSINQLGIVRLNTTVVQRVECNRRNRAIATCEELVPHKVVGVHLVVHNWGVFRVRQQDKGCVVHRVDHRERARPTGVPHGAGVYDGREIEVISVVPLAPPSQAIGVARILRLDKLVERIAVEEPVLPVTAAIDRHLG